MKVYVTFTDDSVEERDAVEYIQQYNDGSMVLTFAASKEIMERVARVVIRL